MAFILHYLQTKSTGILSKKTSFLMELDMNREPGEAILRKLAKGYGLPALSPVALKLLELASDETSSAQQLLEVIEKDPALAVKLLRLANTAFFGSSSKITSLSQAVVRVGFDRVRIMALSISLRNTFPLGKVGPLDYERFWKVSLYRAIISRSLAQYCKSVNLEEAFIAGLIMEIGLLILFDMFIKDNNEIVSLELEPLEEMLNWERKQFGVDHRKIGEYALRFWKFPESIIECQRLLTPEQLEKKCTQLCKISELARICSQVLFQEGSGFNTIFVQGRKILGLDHSTMNSIILAAFDDVNRVANELNLEMDKGKDLIALMEKANRALGQISERITFAHTSESSSKTLPTLDSIRKEKAEVCSTLQAIAHEIRNPLMAVGGFAKRLASTLDPNTEEGKYIQIILGEASRLEKLLFQMTQNQYSQCST